MDNYVGSLFGRQRWLPRLLRATLVLSLLLATLAPQTGFGQDGGVLEAPFGPQLFLLDAVDGQAPQDLPPTVVLHARVEDEAGVRYVASGSEDDLSQLSSARAAPQLLDADTSDDVYYWADGQADRAVELANQVGEILLQTDILLLVAVEDAREMELLETLPASGVSISLLAPVPLAEESAEPGGTNEMQAAATEPNPAVAALLGQLTQVDLKALVEQLSGEQEVVVGGTPLFLNTRYTFSNRLSDAEQFVFEYYQRLGYDVRFENWTYGRYSGRNVVAEVRGTSNPERVLLVGGHLDNISQIPYSSAPGGDDNATGTAATLLLANVLRSYRPGITVRFVHFTGEEQGQWGSKVYARTLRLRGEQVVGYMDLDMIGWDGNGDRVVEIHTWTGPKSNALGTAYLERNERYGLGLTFERKTSSASWFSDHSAFWSNDIGAFLIIENFFTDTRPRDRNPNYHTTNDRSDQVDYDYVARIGRLTLAALAEMAEYALEGSSEPPPTPTPEPSPTPTPEPTPPPAGCEELLVNGDFEQSTSWQFGSTPFAAGYTSDQVVAGSRALRMGIPTAYANRRAHSSAFQRITIPADALAPVTLNFAQRSGGLGDGTDYREVLLLNTSYRYLAKLERSYAAGNDTWETRTFDLTRYRGSTLVLYFNVYNDGSGTQVWNYVDRVTLGNCDVASSGPDEPAPEPTAPPEATPVPSPTETAPEMRLNVSPAVAYLGDLFAADTLTLTVQSVVTDTVTWQATTDAAWLVLSQASGETPGEIGLQMDVSDLPAGIYTGTVTLFEMDVPTQTVGVDVWAVLGLDLRAFLPVVEK